MRQTWSRSWHPILSPITWRDGGHFIGMALWVWLLVAAAIVRERR